MTQNTAMRVRELEARGFKSFDAAHLACAEAGAADVFLTTDDRMFRNARRQPGVLYIRIVNPLVWLQEIIE
jgi:predicted nucleic acid-binding protein